MCSSDLFNFYGQGTKSPNIHMVSEYDDEGADRVKVYWKDKNSSISVKSTDDILSRKYLGAPQEVDLKNYNDDNKIIVLNKYLSLWSTPKPTITFTTRFFLNEIKIMDKISIKIDGIIKPTENQFILDSSVLDGSDVLVGAYGGVVIYEGTYWVVTSISKDVDSWLMSIKAERI